LLLLLLLLYTTTLVTEVLLVLVDDATRQAPHSENQPYIIELNRRLRKK
jgi:hypothetical protein